MLRRVPSVRPVLWALLCLALVAWAGSAGAAVQPYVLSCSEDQGTATCLSNLRRINPKSLSANGLVYVCPSSVLCTSGGTWVAVGDLTASQWVASSSLTTTYEPAQIDYSGWTWSDGVLGAGSGGAGTLEIDVLPTLTPEQGAQIAGAIGLLWAVAWAVRQIRDALIAQG